METFSALGSRCCWFFGIFSFKGNPGICIFFSNYDLVSLAHSFFFRETWDFL